MRITIIPPVVTEVNTTKIFLPDVEATERFGGCLAAAVQAESADIAESGLNVRLEGNLGAGKTATARAFLRALGVSGRIKSPTFTLLETYPLANGLEAFHFDFYRFESPEEFLDAGFRENFAPKHITLVEWSEKALPCLPPDDLTLTLTVHDDGRDLEIAPHSPLGQKVFDEVLRAWNSHADR